MKPLVEIRGAKVITPSGRPLFDGLNLSLARERVALIGRNGVGKSTLLGVLAGSVELEAGRVMTASKPHFVPQVLSAGTLNGGSEGRTPLLSHGEVRKLALMEARSSGAEILLLDEPTEDLDDAGVSWLRSWAGNYPGFRSRSASARCAHSALESGPAQRSFACSGGPRPSSCSFWTSQPTVWISWVSEP